MATQSSTDAAGANSALEPRITVIGVGGAGGNAINNMIRAELKGVEFVVANTDTQALQQSLCATRIQLGARATQGLGAGARPEIGRAAAEETLQAMVAAMRGSNMVFITAGMGGGTGTGAAPVIAREAREAGILTVGVVTKPFAFEGARRLRQAEAGIAELARYVDTLIVIRNQNLFLIAEDTTTFADAFKMADEVLRFGVRGVTDLMVMPGLVNLDFADVRAIMAGMGKAVMGTGEAAGDNRALEAAEAAIANPLLDGISMKGARNVLINITGGPDLTLVEVDIAASRIREEVDADARIIFGSALSDTLGGKIRVSVIATGSDVEATDHAAPRSDRRFVGTRTPNRSTTPAAQMLAWDDEEQDRADDEPITLRLVSKLPGPDLEADPATNDWQLPDPTPDLPAAAAAQPTAPPQAAGLATDGADTPSDGASDGEPLIGDELPSFLTRPSEPAPARAIPMRNIIGALKPKLQRPARPVKSVSTLEAFESVRAREATAKPAANKQLYVVWKAERGARIFTVAQERVAAIQAQPYADRLKLFDNLENAKAEVNAIFKRAAAERTAQGLAGADTDPILADIMGWEENNIPRYPF